jgi:hypothetical protein
MDIDEPFFQGAQFQSEFRGATHDIMDKEAIVVGVRDEFE